MPERKLRTKRQTLRARELRRDVSKTEWKLWPYLRRRQLGVSFRRQHPVGTRYADYFCPLLKLAVEIDGPSHEARADGARDDELARLGVTTLRFSMQEVDENIEGVVEQVRLAVWEMSEGGARV